MFCVNIFFFSFFLSFFFGGGEGEVVGVEGGEGWLGEGYVSVCVWGGGC